MWKLGRDFGWQTKWGKRYRIKRFNVALKQRLIQTWSNVKGPSAENDFNGGVLLHYDQVTTYVPYSWAIEKWHKSKITQKRVQQHCHGGSWPRVSSKLSSDELDIFFWGTFIISNLNTMKLGYDEQRFRPQMVINLVHTNQPGNRL